MPSPSPIRCATGTTSANTAPARPTVSANKHLEKLRPKFSELSCQGADYPPAILSIGMTTCPIAPLATRLQAEHKAVSARELSLASQLQTLVKRMSPLFRDLELIRHNPYGGGSAERGVEHRKERRYSVSLPAEISSGPGGPVWKVRIRDISTRGLQVASDHPVQAG